MPLNTFTTIPSDLKNKPSLWEKLQISEHLSPIVYALIFYALLLSPLFFWCLALQHWLHMALFYEPYFLQYFAMVNAFSAGLQCFLAFKTQTPLRLGASSAVLVLSWLMCMLSTFFSTHSAISWLGLYLLQCLLLIFDFSLYQDFFDFPQRFVKTFYASLLGLAMAYIIFCGH